DLEGPDIRIPELGLKDRDLAGLNRLCFVACGTSWHAALVGKYLVEEFARLPVEVDIASEFRYRRPVLDSRVLTVPISQSGETADTLAALREAKDQGSRAVAICNVVGSSLAREADGVVYTARASRSVSPRPRPSRRSSSRSPSWRSSSAWRATSSIPPLSARWSRGSGSCRISWPSCSRRA